jgi:hypothetical protein
MAGTGLQLRDRDRFEQIKIIMQPEKVGTADSSYRKLVNNM